MNILITGGLDLSVPTLSIIGLKTIRTTKLSFWIKLTYAGNLENLESVKDKIKFIKGDICDQEVVDKTVEGTDVLVHFAAESHVDCSITGPDEFICTNVLGTHQLLKSARKYNIKRFHHVSTDEVFGMLPLNSK